MNQGFRTVIYPAKDITRAKKLFNRLLGLEPIVDQPYYVGYRLGNLDIGLTPSKPGQESAGPIVFYDVSDIKKSLQDLLEEGAQKLQEINDVGGGKLVASVKDPEGNVIGLIQWP